MRIKFLGAAQEVTGSMHLLETAQGSVLIDCGLFQGRRADARKRNSVLPPDAISAEAVLLTHAHIDHSGNLPSLTRDGFQGTIYSTPATRDLCAYMLRDAAHIQESDAAFLNKKYGRDPDWETVEPLYTDHDAVHALGQFMSVPYWKPFEVLPGVVARFLDAGHILGSAQILLEVQERGRTVRIVFSGDLGRNGLPLLRDPEIPPAPLNYVLMESTYGNRTHGDLHQMNGDLEAVINDTVARGGKVIVPSFACERTQEILYVLRQLKREGRLPSIPVYVDSPLAVNVTEVFKVHPECFDKETRELQRKVGSVFEFDGLHLITKVEDSMKLNEMTGPAIIISSSGMCEAGRILHHLRNNIENPRNTIMIVGFQAQHTLGRRLVAHKPVVRIFGVEHEVKAKVVVMNSFSAHADRNDLMNYARACGTGVDRFFLVHGEPDQQEPLRIAMEAEGLRTTVPTPGCTIQLD